MTVVNSDFLDALLTNFQVIFKESFEAAEKVADFKQVVTGDAEHNPERDLRVAGDGS